MNGISLVKVGSLSVDYDYVVSALNEEIFDSFVLDEYFDEYCNETGLSSASPTNLVVTQNDISSLVGAMHFRGVVTPREGESDTQALYREINDPASGDVAIIKTTCKEYIYNEYWVELGDESLYATKAEVAAISIELTSDIAGLTADVDYLSGQIDATNEILNTVSSDYLTSTDKTELEELVGTTSASIYSTISQVSNDLSSDYVEKINNQYSTIQELISDISNETLVSANDYADIQIESLSSDVSTQLNLKQDKLTDPQISAIDSVVDERATVIDFGNDDISTFYWVGEIDANTINDIGLFDLNLAVYQWTKQPYSVKIGSSISSIGKYTFISCKKLSNIILPKSLINIGLGAFYGCDALSNIDIPNNIINIGDSAFWYCAFNEIIIPDNVLSIGRRAFFQLSRQQVEKIIIGNNVSYIGHDAFFQNPETIISTIIVKNKTQEEAEALLANASVPSGCEITTWNDASQEWVKEQNYISSVSNDYKTYDATVSSLSNDGYALSSDVSAQLEFKQDKLTDLQISAIDSVVNERQTIIKDRDGSISSYDIIGTIDIDDYLRDDTKYVTDIKIGNAISSIEKRTGSSELGEGILSNIIIPDSVVNIGKSAFAGKMGLSSINIPNSVTSIGDYAFGNAGIVNILIPDGVEISSPSIFSSCRRLTSIVLPNNLKTITENMFGGCTSLSSITIPNSVENIEQYAFNDCTNLRSVTIPNSVKKIDFYAFADCTNLLSVIIPSSVENIDYYAFENCNNISIIFKDYYDKPLPTGFPWHASTAMSSIWNDASQEWVSNDFISSNTFISALANAFDLARSNAELSAMIKNSLLPYLT